jgi:hypothetical protein
VRNPWERAISYYFSPHRGRQAWNRAAFARLVEDEIHPVRHFLALPKDDDDPFGNVDMVIRFESLGVDFAALCQQLGLPPMDLAVHNRSTRGHYREYYDDGLVDLVASKYADEIQLFGYIF